MKSGILVLALFASNFALACKTDGCVDEKNRQMDAVLSYIHKNDDCRNAVSYLQSLTRIGENDVQAVCGDSAELTTYIYKTTRRADGGYSVAIQAGESQKPNSPDSCEAKAIAGVKALAKINNVVLHDVKVTGMKMTEGDGTRLLLSALDTSDLAYAYDADVAQSEGPCVLIGVGPSKAE